MRVALRVRRVQFAPEAVVRRAATSELQLHSLPAEWLLAVRTGRSPDAAEARPREDVARARAGRQLAVTVRGVGAPAER